MSLAASPSLSLPDALTFSCWIRVNSPQKDAYILHLGETWAADKKGLAVGINGMQLFLRTGDGSVTVVTPEDKSLQPDTWHHVAATIGKGETVLFIDGKETVRAAAPNNPGPFAGVITFGADPNNGHALAADIDELAIDNVARPAAWIAAAYAIQGPDKGLVAVGIEEVSESGGMVAEQMHLMGIVFANLTLDAYVILGILVFMGTFAASVFVYKAYIIWMSGKDTRAFLRSYRIGKGRTCGTDENSFANSPLYRVYKQGCQEMKEVLGDMDDDRSENGEKLSLVGVRAAMDRSYILESKSLNSWLTALVLCTSGGPFLGLLGTVWGVMNTFAAMAATGEANIMAIAPGVASALICTVTGMLVAIPSLMGYNFLLVKIKGLTIDLAVFVDEFGATLDKRYGGRE
jgi:biopolymer transport protein ExbB